MPASHPQTSEDARALSRGLETAAVYLLLLNVIVSIYIEVRVLKILQSSGEDYRVRLLKDARTAAKAELSDLDEEIEQAQEKADARASIRAAVKEFEEPGESAPSDLQVQENPLADQDDE